MRKKTLYRNYQFPNRELGALLSNMKAKKAYQKSAKILQQIHVRDFRALLNHQKLNFFLNAVARIQTQKAENSIESVQKQETKNNNDKDEAELKSPVSRLRLRLQSFVESPKLTKDTKPETPTAAATKSSSADKFSKLKALNALILKSEHEKRSPQSAPTSPIKKIDLNTVSSTGDESEEPGCGCTHFSPAQSSNRRVFIAKIDEKLVNYMKDKSKQWEKYPDQLVDTHCHFDMLFTKLRFSKSIDHYFNQFESLYLRNFCACVAVICNPQSYNSKFEAAIALEILKHPKVYGAIGCHPHFSNTWNVKTKEFVQSKLSDPKIVAIGECGLDVSKKNKVQMETQRLVFCEQLDIAKELNKPIVIHCRGAEHEVFDIMTSKLNSNHRIHLHCFTGYWSIAQKYLRHFPNLCIGVTPLVTSDFSYNVSELAEKISLDRLLLETDAPYFVPQENFPTSSVNFSHPAFVFSVAEHISKIRGIALEELLGIIRKNVTKVYGF